MEAKRPFKDEVHDLYKKGYKVPDVVKKYNITQRMQPERGIPTLQSIHNWYRTWDKQAKRPTLPQPKPEPIHSKPRPLYSAPMQKLPDPTPPSNQPVGSPMITIVSGAEPTIPEPSKTTEQTSTFSQTPAQEEIVNPYGELRFIKLLSSIPSEGASMAFEEAFAQRGVKLEEISFIKWSDWKALQGSSASSIITIATGGLVKPKWLKELIPWYPVIDLVAAYAVPTGAAIIWTLQKGKEGNPPEKEQKEYVRIPDGGISLAQR